MGVNNWVSGILGFIVVLVVSFSWWLGLPIEWMALALGTLGTLFSLIVNARVQTLSGQLDRQHQLRMVALEKRLHAHQEAYALWRKLVRHVYKNDVVDVVSACQAWWDDNCLYLEPQARKAFLRACIHAADQRQFVNAHQDSSLIKENWKDIEAAGDIILESISLPPLGELAHPEQPSSK